MINIFCTIDKFTEEAAKLLKGVGNLECKLHEAEVLLVQLGFSVDAKVIDSAPHLKIIATATTGLDHIDTTYAESKGITIMSLKDETEFLSSITSTAELACGMMIALSRNITGAHASVLSGKWDREYFRGHSLNGRTLGVVGYGRLGKLMAKYGEGLGMNVIFTDPDVEGGISPEELLQQSDVVSIHIHLTKETEGAFCTEALKEMKPDALLINTARGKIVDEDAVIKALQNGKLGGYATDVLADELRFEDGIVSSALIEYAKTHDTVLITPHIGGTTVESREATDIFIAKKVLDALS